MKVETAGQKYILANFENPENGQTIQFIEKQPDAQPGLVEGALVTVNDGTTNEEVIAMMIDRMTFLQNKAPCPENATVITKMKESLALLNRRTADRKARGVEGTNAK